MEQQWFIFDGAEQRTKDFAGREYILIGKKRLLKIKQGFIYRVINWFAGHSWYEVDGTIIDCSGYIEQRCLNREEDYCANLPVS